MYNIAICDDEMIFLEKIDNIVSSFIASNRIVANIKHYVEGSFLLHDIANDMYYDIFILDIEMPGIKGTDIAKKIRLHSSKAIIIFVTSHLQYTLCSFELGIFRYIPKEVLENHLPLALQSAFSSIRYQEDTYYTYINAKRSQKIFYKDIIYIYKSEKNSVFVLKKQEIKVREPLFKIYNNLPSDEFIQADRCYIVNLQYICTVDSVSSQLKLTNNIILNISKNRIQEIKKTINLFWGDRI